MCCTLLIIVEVVRHVLYPLIIVEVVRHVLYPLIIVEVVPCVVPSNYC